MHDSWNVAMGDKCANLQADAHGIPEHHSKLIRATPAITTTQRTLGDIKHCEGGCNNEKADERLIAISIVKLCSGWDEKGAADEAERTGSDDRTKILAKQSCTMRTSLVPGMLRWPKDCFVTSSHGL
jgi:hypothetical protein